MDLYSSIDTSGSAMSAYRTWLDAISDNIANINTVRPMSQNAFQSEYVQMQTLGRDRDGVGTGVAARDIVRGSAQGIVTYQPNNPMADANGDVRMPDVDLSEQMGDMIAAQRAFQANAASVDRAREIYQGAIDIGKNARS